MTAAHWPAGIPTSHDPESWFGDHFDVAAGEIVEFIRADGIEMRGKRLADIGCGDGIIDLGVLAKGEPELLVGYDVRPVDLDRLRRLASEHGLDGMPDGQRLTFLQSEKTHVPSVSGSFDIVYSWSTFEHVDEPVAMFREIRRILKPGGVLFLQVWPLFDSFHGGHLWQSVQVPFAHLQLPAHEVEARLEGRPATDPTRDDAVEEFRSLNRITLDDLQRALLAAGLQPTKVEPIAEAIHVPAELAHLPLSRLTIGGIKLLAVPAV